MQKPTEDMEGRVADRDVTVLIRGESGTGKELAARALYAMSTRSKRRMVTVNCLALTEHILESELFGYAKGAFTGAMQEKKGLFLEADRSTVLLDEIEYSFGELCSLDYNEAKSRLLAEFSTKYLHDLLTRWGGNVTSAAAPC